jgi:hypothetical protein
MSGFVGAFLLILGRAREESLSWQELLRGRERGETQALIRGGGSEERLADKRGARPCY